MQGWWYSTKLIYAYVMSRKRRTVLYEILARVSEQSCIPTHLRTVAAAVVVSVHAPPAIDLRHELQFKMPTALRFTASYDISQHFPSISISSICAHLAAEGAGVACVLRNLHLQD